MPEILIISALIWDFILSEPPSPVHPTVWMGHYISRLWKIKPGSSEKTDFIWGVLIVLSGLFLFTLIPFLVIRILGTFLFPGIQILIVLVSIPLLKVSFSLKYLFRTAHQIRNSLTRDKLDEARSLTSYHLVSRNTENLDASEITSCVIESVSENITDSFTSPVFYFLAGGLPAAWGFRFINTSDAMIAYRNDEFEWGGKFTAWCDSLLNFVPARFTAIMIVLASFLHPDASGRNSWNILKRDRTQTASPNAGWTMSAMAGALNIKLEKKGEYVLGAGGSDPAAQDIDRALSVTAISLLLTVSMLIVLFRGGAWLLFMAV
ncbi:MAG: cobalamin biosynthesis protein [Spirochaetales bacterium]|nr:cobalamin biosynthesis protein [Spirochaetales bacterium]